MQSTPQDPPFKAVSSEDESLSPEMLLKKPLVALLLDTAVNSLAYPDESLYLPFEDGFDF